MFGLSFLQLDLASFWIGFLAASLFWLIVSQITRLIPRLTQAMRQRAEESRDKNLAAIEQILRSEALKHAQANHLAAALFPLDDILIEPRLMLPPLQIDPEVPPLFEPISSQVIPYLPDWPELTANYPIQTLSPLDALSNHANLVLIGQPGAGKTTTLSYIASHFARSAPTESSRAIPFPLLLHFFELNLYEPDIDPLQAIAEALVQRSPTSIQPRIPTLLNYVLKENRLLLLLDGLDELPFASFEQAVLFIQRLHKKYPRVQIVTTADSNYLDGLLASGFQPLSLASWGYRKAKTFVGRWGRSWNKDLAPQIQKQIEIDTVDPILVENWLTNENIQSTPLEWTLKAWGAFSGTLFGETANSGMESFFKRVFATPAQTESIAEFAFTMLSQELAFVESNQARSLSNRSLNTALENQVLVEYSTGKLGFKNPLFHGYLASLSSRDFATIHLEKAPAWPAQAVTLRYLAAQDKASPWIEQLLATQDPPLFPNMMAACRCLSNCSPQFGIVEPILRRLFDLLQDEKLPIAVRTRFVAAFVASNQPSIAPVFRKLAVSNSSAVRQLAALGCGALQDVKSIRDLIGLLSDPIHGVSQAACLALATFDYATAFQAVVESLLSGDEVLRQMAAECLALTSGKGHEILKQTAQIDELLTRRAVVFGLSLLHEPWSEQILEHAAVADSQWVVRSAAASALEMVRSSPRFIPCPPTPQTECSWLIKFASERGEGIPVGRPATEMLLQAYNHGTSEQKLAALQYLRLIPDEGVIGSVYQQLYGDNPALSLASHFAVWFLAAGGASLPSPSQYGLGD